MRLNLNMGVQPYDLLGTGDVILHCRPALTELIEDCKSDPALSEYADGIKDMLLETDLDAGADGLTPEQAKANRRMGLLLTKAVAREVIESWEGVEDPDGSPAPVTADRVDAFLNVPAIYDAFSAVYMGRWLVVQSEKNGSAPSPDGTSAAAVTTAGPARRGAKSAPKP